MSRKEKWEDKEKVIARKEEEEKSFPFLFPLFLRSTHFPPFFYGLSWKWKGEEGLTTGKRREVLRGRGLFCLLSPSSCTMKAVALPPSSSFLRCRLHLLMWRRRRRKQILHRYIHTEIAAQTRPFVFREKESGMCAECTKFSLPRSIYCIPLLLLASSHSFRLWNGVLSSQLSLPSLSPPKRPNPTIPLPHPSYFLSVKNSPMFPLTKRHLRSYLDYLELGNGIRVKWRFYLKS